MTLHKLSTTDLQFVVTRIPKDVRDYMRSSPIWIGGGFIRETISGGEVNDLDLFSVNTDTLTRCSEFLSSKREGSKLHKTKNAITLLAPPRMPVQFITRWTFEEPEKLIASFDFTVCQAVIYFNRNISLFDSIISDSFYQDLAAKRLTYTNPVREEEAGGSMLRVLKFVKRGYNIQPKSLGDVVSRLVTKVNPERMGGGISIEFVGDVIVGLLREVDPNMAVDGLDWANEHELTEL